MARHAENLRKPSGTSALTLPPSSSNNQKRAKVVFGKCHFIAETGRSKCPCQQGYYISSTSDIDTGALCWECSHGIAGHADYSTGTSHPPKTPTGPTEGTPESSSSTMLNSQVCPRSETVEALSHLLDEYGIVHVRGTPASGKTTLATLLRYHLENKCKVVGIDGWKDVHATQYLIEKCHEHGYDHVDDRNFMTSLNDDIVFIIDEAQTTYFDSHLWFSAIKSRLGLERGPRFCLFSSYGSPLTGSPDYPRAVTPAILRPQQRVSMTSSSASKACLFYNQVEFEDVIRRFTSDYTLAKEVQACIFSLSNGHPGMVGALLRFIKWFHKNNLKHSGIREINMVHIRHVLEADDQLFDFLQYDVTGRSLPSRILLKKDLSPEAIDVLLQVLRDGTVEFNYQNESMVYCFRMGFVHVEELKPGETVCVLPSPLHARFVEYYYDRKATQ